MTDSQLEQLKKWHHLHKQAQELCNLPNPSRLIVGHDAGPSTTLQREERPLYDKFIRELTDMRKAKLNAAIAQVKSDD